MVCGVVLVIGASDALRGITTSGEFPCKHVTLPIVCGVVLVIGASDALRRIATSGEFPCKHVTLPIVCGVECRLRVGDVRVGKGLRNP